MPIKKKMSNLMGVSVPLVSLIESGSFLSSLFFALIFIKKKKISIFFLLLEFLFNVTYFCSYVHKTLLALS